MRLDRKIIDEVIQERISPLIAVDGGRIELVDIDETGGAVRVRFGGTYRGSPCQGIVLKYVVEPLLREAISEDVSALMVD